MSGLLVGGIAGVLKSTTPTLFALASGVQWFVLGSTFSAVRGIVLHTRTSEGTRPTDKISASGIAGGIAGGAGGLLRGRKNIVPGVIMFSIFGAAGQAMYNMVNARNSSDVTHRRDGRAWMKSRWSPITVLSDQQYEEMLREKLLRVNAEIALVDESIENLRLRDRTTPSDDSRKSKN